MISNSSRILVPGEAEEPELIRKSAGLKYDDPQPADMAGKIDDQGRLVLGCRRRMGFWGWCSVSFVGLLLVLAAAAGLFLWTLQRDRNSAFLREHFISVLQSGIGSHNEMMLDEAGIRLSGLNPTFSIGGLAISNTESGAYAELERADFGLNALSMWRLTPEAKSIRFDGLKLILPKTRDGDARLTAPEALTLLRATLGAVNFVVSGQDPAFAALSTVEGRNISILQRNDANQLVPLQAGLSVQVDREAGGRIKARIVQPGGAGAVEFTALNDNLPSGERVVQVESASLSAGDLFGLIGQQVKGVDPKLKMSFRLHSRVGADNVLAETGILLTAYDGRIEPPDPDMPPFALDEAALDLRIRAGEPDIMIDRLQVRFNETNIMAHGRISPAANPADGLRLQLKADRADIDRLTPGEPVLNVDSVAAEGVLASDLRSFRLDRLDLNEDDGRLLMTGRFSVENGGLIETDVQASNVDIRKALRIWPVWVAPNVRSWMVKHIDSGRLARIELKSRLRDEALQNAFNHRPIPKEALDVTFEVSETVLKPVEDAAPLGDVLAKGHITGRTAEIDIVKGVVAPQAERRIAIANAKLLVADTSQRPALLEMTIPASGDLRGLVEFLAAPSLKSLVGIPTDVAVTAGSFEGRAIIQLPVALKVAAKDTHVDIHADLREVTVENVVKGEKLDEGSFHLASRSGQLTLKGEGRVFGVQNRIELRSSPGKPAVATIRTTLDEAQLARKGIDFRPVITGSVGASLSLQLGGSGPLEIELDLAKLRIETGVGTLSKRAGQPGRMKFTLVNRPEGTVLDKLEAEFGSVSARGRVELQKDNQFSKAEFASLKLSPGDIARLSVERSRGGYRLVLKANAFDIRPFLQGLQSGRIEEKKSESNAPDMDLDLQSTVLVGFNSELMSAVDVRLARRSGRVKDIALKGRFGGDSITISTLGQESDLARVAIETTDGGALARFLDIYPRAYGGRLQANLLLGAKSQEGVVQVRDFVIRGEPGLRSVRNAGHPSQSVQGVVDQTQFTKMRADFIRDQGKLTLRDAVMWGSDVGGTLEGTLDYARDRVSLKGAFVPAYALNNLFAQLPIIGRLLGGGQYEGLFAVPFVITGKASAPVLRTNPVSAIAPGFLRKFFEIQREK
jgi:hypothetical protein